MGRRMASIQSAARVGFVLAAWALTALVFVQVFHAGTAVLVRPGDWAAPIRLGHGISLPILAMVLLSLLGGMPARFLLLSFGLYGLYALQYVFLHLPPRTGLPALAALHAVNALVLCLSALHGARASWRLVTGSGPQGHSHGRALLAAAAAMTVLVAAAVGLGTGRG